MIHMHVFIEQQLSSIHVHASENKASLDEQKRKVTYVILCCAVVSYVYRRLHDSHPTPLR